MEDLIRLIQKKETELTEQDKEYLKNLTEDDEETINFLICVNPNYIKYLNLEDDMDLSEALFLNTTSIEQIKVLYQTRKNELNKMNINNEYELIWNLINYNKAVNDLLKEDMDKIEEQPEENPELIKQQISNELDLLSEYLPIETVINLSRANINITSILNNKEKIEKIINTGLYRIINYINPNITTEDIVIKAIQKGYKYSDTFYYKYSNFEESQAKLIQNIIKNSKECVNLLIDKSYKGDIINIVNEDILTEEMIEKAFKNGYEISDKSPQVIFNKKEYVKKGFEQGKLFALDRTNLNIIDDELVFLAMQKGYYIHKETPEKIKNNKNYIKYNLEHCIQYSVDKYKISSIINNINPELIDDEIFLLAVQKGYKINKNSPDILKNSKKYIKLNLEYMNKKSYTSISEIKDLIDNIKPNLIDEEIFILGLKMGYIINRDTPEIIKNNKNYVKLSFKYYDKNELNKLLKSVNPIIFDEEIVNILLDQHHFSLQSTTPEEIIDIIIKNENFLQKFIKEHKVYEIMMIFKNIDNPEQKLSKEELLILKYMIKYPNLLHINFIKNSTLTQIYKSYFENNKLCEILFLCGEYQVLKELIQNQDSMTTTLSLKLKKAIKEYNEQMNNALKEKYRDYIMKNLDKIELDKIEQISNILMKISLSNSSEIQRIDYALADQLLELDNSYERLNKIEDIFLKNHLPTVGKIFSVFEILYPNFKGFNFSEGSSISPTLKNKSNQARQIIIFADLIKSFMGSNNRGLKKYIENLEQGNNIFINLCNNNQNITNLNEQEQEILKEFVMHLNTLYNNTQKGKKDNKVLTGNIISDIEELKKLFSPNGNLVYDLPDRIIKMYCHFAGIDTLEQAKAYMKAKIKEAETRNEEASKQPFQLKQGDFIKGIGDIAYLSNILQNGSVAREFLGSSAGSDATPLDTDLSLILTNYENIEKAIRYTEAGTYGPIYFVLKNRDNRFTITRKSPKEQNQEVNQKMDLTKLELFYTGVVGSGHYGIRTGFASSEIDYIITSKPDNRIGLEIVKNGFYIPVVDKAGKLLFSKEDYDKLKEKMQGLSYYDEENYKISDLLENEEILKIANQLKNNEQEVERKRKAINNVIKEVIKQFNLNLKEQIDGDLQEGFIELIDTGSTGRGTNMPGDGDFDYMMRLDKSIISDEKKLESLKQALLQTFQNVNTTGVIGTGDFRLKQVYIEGLEEPVDIDITFTERTDKLAYSTDMCVQDRLKSIKKQYPDKYNLVIANIIKAKELLKEAEAYKPDRGEKPQGGLGGVGVENWILQNGGSLQQAALDFLRAAQDKTFEQFKKTYQIYDFGENHLSQKRGTYPHDNFIYNMNETGYEKMKQCLKEYLLSYEHINEEEKGKTL